MTETAHDFLGLAEINVGLAGDIVGLRSHRNILLRGCAAPRSFHGRDIRNEFRSNSRRTICDFRTPSRSINAQRATVALSVVPPKE